MIIVVMIAVIIVWIICGLGLCLRLWLLYCGWRLRRFVKVQLRKPLPESSVGVSLIAPCKGIDPGFAENVAAVLSQQYPGFWEVIFVVESIDDPAYAVLSEMLKKNPKSRACIRVAGVTENCSQKIHNMLAGVASANPLSEVFAFVDSDVRPSPDWLAHLTAPLSEFEYPASTGYRWYVPVQGGRASAIRAVWNALVSTAGDPRWGAYAWGGSFALRRQAYKRMHMGRLWSKALSEDMLLTSMIREDGKKVAFVSQCVIPSYEDCNWEEGFDFMRRQSLVARVYGPRLWQAGWALCLAYLIPLVVSAMAAACWLLVGWAGGYHFLAGVGLLYGLDLVIAVQRRKTVKQILPDCDFSKTRWMGTFGQVVVVVVSLGALICSRRSRKMLWRGRTYTLVSPQETLVE